MQRDGAWGRHQVEQEHASPAKLVCVREGPPGILLVRKLPVD
jgi:hypothetical protein